MSAAAPSIPARRSRIGRILESNTYLIFILVLTIFSLSLMVVQMLLSPDTETWKLVNFYDNLICIIFLIDFAMHMYHEPVKKDYFIGQRGYFDLLGSIPSFGFSQYTVILRVFRLSRLLRLRKILKPENRKLLREEILDNRGSYALFITALLAAIVLMVASILVLAFESKSPDANITNGGNALWWAVVTITTVGYGDRYPVTSGGRWTAVFVMFAGVGIIGALASILASILVPQPKQIEKEIEDVGEEPAAPSKLEEDISSLKDEIKALRQLLEKRDSSS